MKRLCSWIHPFLWDALGRVKWTGSTPWLTITSMWKSEMRRTTVAFLWQCWKWSMPQQPTRDCTLVIITTHRQKKMRSKAGAFTSMCQVSWVGAWINLVVLNLLCSLLEILKNIKVIHIYWRKSEKFRRTHKIKSRSFVSHYQEIFIVYNIDCLISHSYGGISFIGIMQKKSEMYSLQLVKFHKYLLFISCVLNIVLSVEDTN